MATDCSYDPFIAGETKFAVAWELCTYARLCAFRAVFNCRPFKTSLDELLNLMLQVEKAYDVNHPAAPRVKTGLLAQLFTKLRTTYDLRDTKDRLPESEFRDLMNADVDAAQSWAFDNFSRQKFTDLRILLQQISDEVSP